MLFGKRQPRPGQSAGQGVEAGQQGSRAAGQGAQTGQGKPCPYGNATAGKTTARNGRTGPGPIPVGAGLALPCLRALPCGPAALLPCFNALFRLRLACFVALSLTTVIPLAPARAATADSLWSSASQSLFSDNKARRAGDILTILIEEQTSASAQATTKADKSEDSSFGPGFGPILKQIKQFGLSGSTNINAQGQTARSGALSGRITVTVKSVDPSGNLVLEGVREIKLNAETQKIVLRGLVRPVDVSPENTVLSSLIADATISFDGKGVIGDKQRPGLITRIFRFLF